MQPSLKPVYADIGIIESCNLRCQMCRMYENKSPAKEDFIPNDKWEQFFDDLKEIAGVGFIFNLPGGEPLLHPQIFDIIQISSERGLKPLLSTNGFMLTKDIAKKLIESGLFAATISLDSSIPEIHDKIRGIRGTFERLNIGIRMLEFYSKIYRNEVFNTGVQCVIQKQNLDNIPGLVLWVEKNPLIKRINLNLLMQPNNTDKNDNWFREEFKHIWPEDHNKVGQVIDRLIELKKAGGASKLLNTESQLESYKAYYKNPKCTPKLDKCSYDKSICTNSKGDIHLCYYYEPIGNLKNDRLKEVWDSEKANGVREKINQCRITDCWFRLNCLYTE